MSAKFFLIIICAFASLMACNSDDDEIPNDIEKPRLKADVAMINPANKLQKISGFGVSTAFRMQQYPLNDSEMDLLFNDDRGELGFSIMRIQLMSDENQNAREIELEHAKATVARGGIVVASPWSPPERMKTNNSMVGGRLKTDAYEEYAEYLNDFAIYMEENGAPLYAVSIQNEPDIEVDYDSCDWTPQELLNFTRDYGNLISETRLMSGESFNFNHAVTNPLLEDETAVENIDIIGGHIYGGGLQDYPLAREKEKEVWMTEHLELETDWDAVFATGKEIQDCLTIANFNAYIWWYARRYYGPLDEDGTVTKRGEVMSHFSKFIRPGFQRIEATLEPNENISVSAFSGEGQTVIVAINEGDTPVLQQFAFESGGPHEFTSFQTSENESLKKEENIILEKEINAFESILRPQTITTFISEN